ncbi:MAG: phosphatidylglycerol lysyltransferase domain-containing protein, partial [Muribaculaceae bacterium]|nr:phosphatidylglycerol lysyltransferase domain-containing protein [Muribaculaceae bacterium]
YKDTLFIKGVVENDLSKPAFSLPVGALPLSESVRLLKEYCRANNLTLEFSAVPEYALAEMQALNPVITEELKDWGDYLYEAVPLATVAGKKMSKKRNHVHQFEKNCNEWHTEWITPENADKAYAFMDIFDLEGDSSMMAKAERELSRQLILRMQDGDRNLEGMLLYADGEVCAYTIGDVKGDTLFVHVEKATRGVNSSYEMINYQFAKAMCEKHPEIAYINREDDAGDIGLRMAKESYHPVEILKKYNIIF